MEYNIIKDVKNIFRLKKKIKKEIDYTTIIDVRNLFRLMKETNNATIKDIINFFRLEKENKAMKDRIIRDIINLFEHEEEETNYKPVRVGNFCSNNYIKYESNSNRNKTLSVEEYLHKI